LYVIIPKKALTFQAKYFDKPKQTLLTRHITPKPQSVLGIIGVRLRGTEPNQPLVLFDLAGPVFE